jgi:LemA protein
MIILILTIILAILIFSSLSVFGWGIGIYNSGKTFKQDIKTQLSNIKTEYQRRADLFYNLVQTVKGAAKFEKSTLIGVIAMRRGLEKAATPSETLKEINKMDDFFSRLMVTVESYPQLKSIEAYNNLMTEIRITEDRINVSRTDFNNVVREYNVLVTTFPSGIIAKMFGFKEEDFYINETDIEKSSKISLELD